VAPEGRKVGSLKRRLWSHLGSCEIKNCSLLWREEHVEVKMLKHFRSEPLLAVETWKKCTPLRREARLEVKNQKGKSTSSLERSWKLRCSKVARGCGAKHIPKSNCQNPSGSEHFWQWSCQKSAHGGGAKRISKSEC